MVTGLYDLSIKFFEYCDKTVIYYYNDIIKNKNVIIVYNNYFRTTELPVFPSIKIVKGVSLETCVKNLFLLIDFRLRK